jgi:hypothetical protein
MELKFFSKTEELSFLQGAFPYNNIRSLPYYFPQCRFAAALTSAICYRKVLLPLEDEWRGQKLQCCVTSSHRIYEMF